MQVSYFIHWNLVSKWNDQYDWKLF